MSNRKTNCWVWSIVLIVVAFAATGCATHSREANLDGFLTLGDDMGHSTLCDASSAK